MLDSLSKKIIKNLKNKGKDETLVCSLDPNFSFCNDLELSELAAKCSTSEAALLNAFAYLVDIGLMEYQYSGNLEIGVCLTHQGLFHQELSRKQLLQDIIRSIVFPIIVSIITSLTWESVWGWIKLGLSGISRIFIT